MSARLRALWLMREGFTLPGAYKNSKTEHSTITDNEGKFSINLFRQKEPVLIVSYLGMIVQEVKSCRY